jgi:DNA-binding NarL/FixJ family response regulator
MHSSRTTSHQVSAAIGTSPRAGVAAACTTASEPPRQWPLTRRETEVLAAMAAGKTNAAIAEHLVISRKAVEKHVNSIFSKLLLSTRDELHPRVQAVLIYLARGPREDVPAESRVHFRRQPVLAGHNRRYSAYPRGHCRP